MGVIVRSETPEDVLAIHSLTREAFLGAPHTDHTEQFVIDALRRAGSLTLSLVAEEAGVVVGHVAVSPVSIADGTTGWFGLGPISVAPSRQGRGIGSTLMKEALGYLREQGAAGCVVLGEPGYYSRFGFRQASALVLPEVPPAYFQAVAFGPSMPTGIVSYHEAFNARE